jgi:hypothetical protein
MKSRVLLDYRGWSFLEILLLAIIVCLLVLQMRSLYVSPIADSYLWWGDETWLMLEFRTQIMEGALRHPLALASSLSHGNGILFSIMWVPAVLYGAPAALLPTVDIVDVGRTVTAALSILLLLAVYVLSQRIGSSRTSSLFAVLLVLVSRSFLLTSHSARYDILSALAITIGFFAAIHLARKRSLTATHAYLCGVLVAASLLITVHVTLALGLTMLVAVAMASGVGTRFSNVARYTAGGLSVVFVVLLIFWMVGNRTLLMGGSANGYALNLQDVPVFRPLSRSVQLANLDQKLTRFARLAPGMFAVSILCLLAGVAFFRRNLRAFLRPVPVLLGILVLSWVLIESSAPPSYLIYILPPLALTLSRAITDWSRKPWTNHTLGTTALLVSIFAVRDARITETRGLEVSSNNEQAVDAALRTTHTIATPLVVVFNPGIHVAIRDTSVRVMTTHFVEFPDSIQSAWQAMQQEHADFVLLYKSPVLPDYMREVGPISEMLAKHGSLVHQQTGRFTDIGRSYFGKWPGTPDTIQLYRLHD